MLHGHWMFSADTGFVERLLESKAVLAAIYRSFETSTDVKHAVEQEDGFLNPPHLGRMVIEFKKLPLI